MGEVAVILYSARRNQYGLNVLAAALELEEQLGICQIHFANSFNELVRLANDSRRCARKTLICFSFLSPTFPDRVKELEMLKELVGSEGILYLAGGPHPTAAPASALNAGWDLVCLGEGEEMIRSLVRSLAEERQFESIPGLAFKRNSRLYITGRAKEVDLDRYPPFSVRHRRFNPIEITRGCVYACKFCQTPFLFRAKWRHRSIVTIAEAVSLMSRAGLRDVRFISPSALSYGSQNKDAKLEQVEELLSAVRRAIGPNGRIFFGSFPSELRPEHITPEALRLLRQYVANDNIVIGMQSGSDRLLKACGRGHTVEQAIAAVRYTLEAGFKANVDLIFGLPGETEEDREATFAIAKRLCELGARIHAHIFLPIPGTPWHAKKPAVLPEKWMRVLGKLSGQGLLYGSWRTQATMSKVIYELQENNLQSGHNEQKSTTE